MPTEMTESAEKLPRYNLKEINRISHELYRQFIPFVGTRPAGSQFRDLVRMVSRQLHAPPQVIQDTMAELTVSRLDDQMARRLASRLAGNYRELRRGEPPLQAQFAGEIWAPALVQDVQILPATQQQPQSYALLTAKILAGPACPELVAGRLSLRACRALSRRLGFTLARGRRPYTGPADLRNLQVFVKLRTHRNGQLTFSQVRCTDGMRQANIDLIASRRCSHGIPGN